MKAMSIVIGLALGLAVGLGGGYLLWGANEGSTTTAGPGGGISDREAMANMTEEERQAFFAEQGMEPPSGGFGADGGMRGGAVVEGTVLAADAQSIMIELAEGGSQTVYLDSDTTYAETSDSGSDLLVEGATVQVSGVSQADGVFTAANVVVSP